MPTKTLPYDAKEKIVSNVHFVRAAFERMVQEGIVDFAFDPRSDYHYDFIEHTVTFHVTFRTEYSSEEARQKMIEVLGLEPEEG